MSMYLEKAAEQLRLAGCSMPGSGYERQHLDLAAKFERLAMIEQGLLPGDAEEQAR